MPRVKTRTKNRAGAQRTCGRCGAVINPGDSYYTWEFRYGGAQYRCSKHYPRQSELTQSKMAAVYAAVEDAQDQINGAGVETLDELTELVQGVGEVAREVAEEYREADEAFGGQGATESAERADELDSWADELEQFEADTSLSLEDNAAEANDGALGSCPL